VRTVAVHLDSGGGLALGPRVAADVLTPLEHQNAQAELGGGPLRYGQAEQAGPDDDQVRVAGCSGRGRGGRQYHLVRQAGQRRLVLSAVCGASRLAPRPERSGIESVAASCPFNCPCLAAPYRHRPKPVPRGGRVTACER